MKHLTNIYRFNRNITFFKLICIKIRFPVYFIGTYSSHDHNTDDKVVFSTKTAKICEREKFKSYLKSMSRSHKFHYK